MFPSLAEIPELKRGILMARLALLDFILDTGIDPLPDQNPHSKPFPTLVNGRRKVMILIPLQI